MPTRIQSAGAERRARMRPIRSRSVNAARVAADRSSLAISFRVIHGARLADDRHLDLARILELVLDAPRDVLREPDRFLVGNLLALDHDPDFAPGLQRERLRHALERIGDPLELLEPFDVRLEDVAARAGTRGGDRVRRLDD